MSEKRLQSQLLAIDVDKHGVLRIPTLFWVSIAILARHWVLVLAVFVSARRTTETVLLLGDGPTLWILLAIELPVLLLAFAGGRREPGAGRITRWIWRHGKQIIALTAIANAAWTGRLLWLSDYWMPWPELFLASCVLLDIAIAWAMFTTPHLRLMFEEFPEPTPAKPAA